MIQTNSRAINDFKVKRMDTDRRRLVNVSSYSSRPLSPIQERSTRVRYSKSKKLEIVLDYRPENAPMPHNRCATQISQNDSIK